MTLKILLADDSMIAQSMGKKILTEAGYDVVTVSNGAAAVKKIPEVKPDIIVLDVYMPGYNGLEVCQRVRSAPATADVPVLLTVGKLEPFNPEDGMRVKADGVIVKPFEATDLITVVGKLAERVHDASAPRVAAPRSPEATAAVAAPVAVMEAEADVHSAPGPHPGLVEGLEGTPAAASLHPVAFAEPGAANGNGRSRFGLDLGILTESVSSPTKVEVTMPTADPREVPYARAWSPRATQPAVDEEPEFEIRMDPAPYTEAAAAEERLGLEVLDLPGEAVLPVETTAALAAAAPSMSTAPDVPSGLDVPSFEITLEPLPDAEVELSFDPPEAHALETDAFATQASQTDMIQPAPEQPQRLEQAAPVPLATTEPLEAVSEQALASTLHQEFSELLNSAAEVTREPEPDASLSGDFEEHIEHLLASEMESAAPAAVEATSASAPPLEEAPEAAAAEPEVRFEAAPAEPEVAFVEAAPAEPEVTEPEVKEPEAPFAHPVFASVVAEDDPPAASESPASDSAPLEQPQPTTSAWVAEADGSVADMAVEAEATAAIESTPVAAAEAPEEQVTVEPLETLAMTADAATEPPPVPDTTAQTEGDSLAPDKLDSLTAVLAEQLADRVLQRLKVPLVQEIKRILCGK